VALNIITPLKYDEQIEVHISFSRVWHRVQLNKTHVYQYIDIGLILPCFIKAKSMLAAIVFAIIANNRHAQTT
jgi:hypothetical protein